jgi:antitoxin CcdA
MQPVYNTQAPKKPTNITLNSDLLEISKSLKINLSATVEAALADIVAEKLREIWLSENRQAIQAYNDHTETHGTFSDGLRGF